MSLWRPLRAAGGAEGVHVEDRRVVQDVHRFVDIPGLTSGSHSRTRCLAGSAATTITLSKGWMLRTPMATGASAAFGQRIRVRRSSTRTAISVG